LSPASALASSESSTSYGRLSTFSTKSFGGRIPLNGLIIAMTIINNVFILTLVVQNYAKSSDYQNLSEDICR
jgi:hypothetical protein